MLTLPAHIMDRLDPFAPVFSRRVWRYVPTLVGGAILAPGRRMVSSTLRVMGLGHCRAFSTYHRVLNRDVWSSLRVSRILLGLLVAAFAPDGPLVIGLDATLERRRGPTISAAGIYRDPVRSSHSHFVKVRALRWVSLMLLVPIPWAHGTWALPFLTALAPSERYDETRGQRHKAVPRWAQQMILLLHRWYPDRALVIVGDQEYAAIDLRAATRQVATIVTRLRLDAHLCEPAPPRQLHQQGRPRVVGPRLPTLAARVPSWYQMERHASIPLKTAKIEYGGPGWIWVPKYTADAIARWQAERGTDRSALYDHKDRDFADLLFTQRGKRMGATFLNRSLIPLLCARAGVDPFDAEGAYTAHRGRSARISLLHACGLELEDLAAYAIHKDTRTIKTYARRNPIHLHRKVARADTLSTVIEGLYDPDADARGTPSVHWFLGYDADGPPQFCGLPAHHICPHRMDCPHCGLFIGGARARLIHDDPSLLPVTAEVSMTQAQRLLSQGQVAAAEQALEELRAVPTPVPPSAAYLTNPAGLGDDRLVELADLATEDALTQLTLVEGDLAATLST